MISSRGFIFLIIDFLRQTKFKFELWQILLSLSITAGSSAFLLYQSIFSGFLNLNNFNDRTIGIVIFNAIDASHRTFLYVGIWVFAFLLFCTTLLIFVFINEKYFKQLSLEFEKELLFYLSLFSVASLFLYALSRQEIFISSYKIFLIFLCLVGCLIVLKIYATRQKNGFFLDLFSTPAMVIISFVVPFVCIFVYWILLDRIFSYSAFHLYLFAAIWIIFVLGLYSISKHLERNFFPPRKIENSLSKPLIFLLLIPLSVPLSNELQYTLSG